MNNEKNFEKITMFQCKYCGKRYLTTRHQCKFDKEKHNCFSCQYMTGIQETNKKIFMGDNWYEEENDEQVISIVEKSVICKVGKCLTLNKLAKNKWELECDLYKELEDYEGKNTFLNNLFSQSEPGQNE